MGKPCWLDKKKGQAQGSNVTTGSPDGQCPGGWISLEWLYIVDISAVMSKDPSVSDPQECQGLPLVWIQMLTVHERSSHHSSPRLLPCRDILPRLANLWPSLAIYYKLTSLFSCVRNMLSFLDTGASLSKPMAYSTQLFSKCVSHFFISCSQIRSIPCRLHH